LSSNQIGNSGVIALAGSLKSNMGLSQLSYALSPPPPLVNHVDEPDSLFGNEIGDAGAIALAESLKENQSLKQLE
jgi:hypothetical protein